MKAVVLISSLYVLLSSCNNTTPKTSSPVQQPIDSSLATSRQTANDSVDKNTNTESLHDADYGIYHIAALLNNKVEKVYLKGACPGQKSLYL